MDEQEEAMKKLTPVPKALNSRLIALQAMQLIAQSILQLKYIGKEMDNLVFLAGHYHTDVQTILETTPPDQFLTIVDQLRKQAKEKHRRSPVLEQAKKHLQRNPGEISAFRRALEEAIEEDIMDEFGDRNEVALAHGLFT
ncbi:hypothetical protein GNI_061530 [Gregarina niphandrodes]|uniref:Uncharacterized protein n=1 Tax=Gregarina niphandrodes TaxID=110365 RepID=A0A023B888_GRENI|nr:hypothetical protein GNI_061530 [Gregarina niphandrodes]EZG68708.1 hypothetical protein GNI_061530 [Gregarina niphandrodes]|eukprot:XP_011134552.1 hypothetical protein GNI_061530 [Gregarina niphandrodes]